jgi:hypothetical protein
MKHLFNDIPKSEKQRILEMHGVKRNLVNESDTELESALSKFESLEEGEKIKWKDAIQQCIEEMGLSNKIKRDSKPFIYLAALAAGGIMLGITALTGMAVVPAILIGIVEAPMINKIRNCARKKRKESKESKESKNKEPMEEQAISGITPTQTKKVKISLISPDGSEKVLWDGNKVVDPETTIRVLKREMNYKNPTEETMSSNLNNILAYINARIREGGGTEFGEKYKVS